jgi:hypothetical protein
MNDLLEDNLREILSAYDASYDPAPALGRVLNRSYHPHKRRRRRLWAVVGGFATTAAAATVTVILLLSSGASIAYAGWDSPPGAASPAAVTAAAAACNEHPPPTPGSGTFTDTDPQVFVGQPVLSEARGIYTALIAVTDGYAYACLAAQDQNDQNFEFEVSTFGPVQSTPARERITPPYPEGNDGGRVEPKTWARMTNLPASAQQAALERLLGGGYGENMLGRAGSDVSAVSIAFANSDTVDATVQNGWYFAWWPWLSSPTSMTITTSAGTTTSPILSTGSPRPTTRLLATIVPQCQPGTTGCVFSNTTGTLPSTSSSTSTTPNTSGNPTTPSAGTNPTSPAGHDRSQAPHNH